MIDLLKTLLICIWLQQSILICHILAQSYELTTRYKIWVYELEILGEFWHKVSANVVRCQGLKYENGFKHLWHLVPGNVWKINDEILRSFNSAKSFSRPV